ncbi:Tesmin/TSO1-like CXC domain-containing protein, putative isoform 1 [Hibiscus syriacus]|uniref:Tesmin/TSO1-like CXC domain-containing protein, putative isoform 1 n=1 Tax=Hibiscus syriacus TaxID=106335 RepID=A0A6A3D0I0_HIBSY|nr:Tesmin/TSO1-like CXC domain-containing protein, putative isoform 1 [Hibiscus syriacus]
MMVDSQNHYSDVDAEMYAKFVEVRVVRGMPLCSYYGLTQQPDQVDSPTTYPFDTMPSSSSGGIQLQASSTSMSRCLQVQGEDMQLPALGMGLKLGEEGGGVTVSDENPKMKASGINANDMIFRADKIDFKTLDMQLEKHLNLVWSKNVDEHKPTVEWDIDLAKLELRYAVARGTYGTVYRATYDNKDVAVKVLDWSGGGASETAAIHAAFKQEVAVWHKLNHPNVTKFVGASMGASNLKIQLKYPSIEGRNSLPSRACCVVVEYLPGGTLKQHLIRNRRKKHALKVVVQLALNLSRGLSYLNSKRIVHRDVKTENLLLDAKKTSRSPILALLESKLGIHVLNGKPYNRKCDVYSFGICLWEIYCCDMPYPDLSFIEISSAVVGENLRPEIPRCCPSSLANIMRKCWDANPTNRPEMEEVVTILEAVNASQGGGMIPEDRSPGCFCLAPPEMNATLTTGYTPGEIHHKAPGIASLPRSFFRSFWPIVGDDIINLCMDLLAGRERMENVNHTVLVNRTPLGVLLSSWTWKRLTIEWNDLFFMRCSFVWGSLNSGLRQGDPLSSFLFVLCAQGLSSVLHSEQLHNRISGLRISRHGLSITHFFYAEFQRIREVLDQYEIYSGKKVRMFGWRAAREALLVGCRLSHVDAPNVRCCWCCALDETVAHALMPLLVIVPRLLGVVSIQRYKNYDRVFLGVLV